MSPYEVGHWIAGAASRGSGERQQDIYNPATGTVQGRLLLGSAADLGAAVATLQATLPPLPALWHG